ncbi:hypothetical protein [Pantoea phytobeneficialis]|uniref:DUF4222 domain-containing protein n=1 Tax=Pantoea phytobeneficialis TaxID=2052056 RepID=A0ABT8XTQ6_9GAMM|nr:hypothetical protein [Pantoea phytobeneficialis]MDO6406473.1 hypothetical protein [Pantoea phytobeneficialis]
MTPVEFKERLSRWPGTSFMHIEWELHNNQYEIYATGDCHFTRSRLFLCRVPTERQSRTLTSNFREWLPRINRILRKEKKKYS